MNDDVTIMRDAKPGDAAWVYPLPIEWHGEYGWTTDVSAEFEEIDEPVTIVRQRWLCERTETVIFHPRTELCPTCHGEEEIPEGDPPGPDGGGYHMVACPTCPADPGRHPFAGQMEIVRE